MTLQSISPSGIDLPQELNLLDTPHPDISNQRDYDTLYPPFIDSNNPDLWEILEMLEIKQYPEEGKNVEENDTSEGIDGGDWRTILTA